MTKMVSTRLCKKQLAILWFGGGLALFLLLILQSIFGKYGNKAADAWAWFLPTTMPTLSLILGVLLLDMGGGTDKLVERFYLHITYALSCVYLVMVGMVPLLQPLTAWPPIELMTQSSLWLGPLQGLVAAALGAFFVKAERGGGKERENDGTGDTPSSA